MRARLDYPHQSFDVTSAACRLSLKASESLLAEIDALTGEVREAGAKALEEAAKDLAASLPDAEPDHLDALANRLTPTYLLARSRSLRGGG